MTDVVGIQILPPVNGSDKGKYQERTSTFIRPNSNLYSFYRLHLHRSAKRGVVVFKFGYNGLFGSCLGVYCYLLFNGGVLEGDYMAGLSRRF